MRKEAMLRVPAVRTELESGYLDRTVDVDVYIPSHVKHPEQMSLLLINDGQDLPKMPFDEILGDLYYYQEIEPLVCVGIHCGPDRKNEYGVARKADYLGRGSKAGAYTRFVFNELLPLIRKEFHLPHFREKAFAGFSLGGLMALDLVWNHPHEFTKVGVFSGSLWWRQKAYEDGYNDETDRIMHNQVREGEAAPWLQFFFQTGALDENKDRNNNGVIDSIDDTLDLIALLEEHGYPQQAIKYLELADGKHDVATWGQAFPDFLKWGWGRHHH
ncbi:MAG TPA: alpha/beta hydrolase-fold protein [Lacibacter sp.]|nr:alpha/beta hydrolase-fold protein [Lacibacter sp.]HMO90033.1 alpha/beta hydrolase-fold protein [Lacibacter sp.]HMP87216.1 alpha/beta hydrolase-fold protein [Lacibacter sp.]